MQQLLSGFDVPEDPAGDHHGDHTGNHQDYDQEHIDNDSACGLKIQKRGHKGCCIVHTQTTDQNAQKKACIGHDECRRQEPPELFPAQASHAAGENTGDRGCDYEVDHELPGIYAAAGETHASPDGKGDYREQNSPNGSDRCTHIVYLAFSLIWLYDSMACNRELQIGSGFAGGPERKSP